VITQTLSAHGYRYLFGPVFSRRLGRSLGIDLLPYKTCSLDCIYCECGSTTDLSSTLGELVPVEAVLAELDAYLSQRPPLDFVTFAGSGEPTLHTGLGELIAGILRDGKAEGVFNIGSPDHAAAILVAMLLDSGEALSRMVFAGLDGTASFEEIEIAISAYNEAFGRILGLSSGSFEIIDSPTLRFWLDREEHP